MPRHTMVLTIAQLAGGGGDAAMVEASQSSSVLEPATGPLKHPSKPKDRWARPAGPLQGSVISQRNEGKSPQVPSAR